MVQCKPLPFLDIESFCLMLDNPVLWQHSRPIKVTPTWKSGFIPANCGTHSIYLVCKTSVKLVKKDKNESKWLQNFLNKSVQSKFLYGNLVLSQSTMTLIWCLPMCLSCFEGHLFLNKKLNPRKKYASWTCELKCSVFVKVWHKKLMCGIKNSFQSMFGRSRKGSKAVTPYDDITEGLKGIYKQRLLPLEKVSCC